MYFLGIDGGGTKTTCLICDENLNEIFRTVGSSINFYSEGMENARRNMKKMLCTIKEKTGISHFDGVCVGSSALFSRADEKTMYDFCDGVFDSDKIIMDSDLFIALKATGKKNSAVVIAGTGSMAAGFNEKDEIITKGGYGYILGDEGSGYRIALDGIRAGVRSLDKTGENTLLGDMLLEFSGVKTAVSIIKSQAVSLACTLRSLLSEMPEKPYVALFGGVFQHSEIFLSHFRKEIAEICCEIELMEKEPVYGACIAAKELCQ